MSEFIQPINILPDIYPKEWKNHLNFSNTDVFEYRNLQHFKNHVASITQKQDSNCNVSYNKALKELLENKATMTQGEYEVIKNTVKNNLMKRGLISDTIYESYKYDVQGDIVDVAKLIAQDPNCCLVPNHIYENYFYELYISVSYHCGITNETVMQNMAKILATVQLLEEQRYYCKITLVFPDKDCGPNNNDSKKRNFMSMIPLFNHKDLKTIEYMSSVLNDRLLRKFYFAVLEEHYGSDLQDGYGHPVDLPNAIVPVDLKEEELCANILDQIIKPCTTR